MNYYLNLLKNKVYSQILLQNNFTHYIHHSKYKLINLNNMKKIFIITSLSLITIMQAISQTTIKHPHCKCEDLISTIEPSLNGDFQRTCKGKVVIQGKFNNGLKDGSWITKSKNGKVIRKFNYNNGVIDGNIEVNYSSGAKKVVGEFNNGRKSGTWTYYNEKGKTIKIGNFNNGIPEGIWTFYDLKGKKELVVYDFDKEEYVLNKSSVSLFGAAPILQNDNSAEWWIRHVHDSGNEKYKPKPFEGYKLTTDLNVLLMEIPLEFWETYVSYKLQADLQFDKNALVNVDVKYVEEHLNDVPEIGFFATTNNADKLTEVNHHILSKKLLAYNISEAIWLMGPWINVEEDLKIYLPYVLNSFKNSPFK